MKTTNLISDLPRNLVGIIVIIVAAFTLSSCNKDELFPASPPTSSSSSSNGATDESSYGAVDPVNLSYQVLTINHLAARSLLPDYQVAVHSDRNVVFEGRRNTAFTGTKTFKIDERTFSMLKEMFISSHLFDIPLSAGSVAGSILADVPQVLTSFNNDGTHAAITLTDYNNPREMPELISLRTRAEALLNIDYLIAPIGSNAGR